MSVTKLHKWAVEKKIIHEKLEKVGYLIPELASGTEHPQHTKSKKTWAELSRKTKKQNDYFFLEKIITLCFIILPLTKLPTLSPQIAPITLLACLFELNLK